MARQEEENRKRTKRANLNAAILSTIAAVGVLAATAVVPNAVGTLIKHGFIPLPRQKEFIREARKRLERNGLIEYREGKARLTEKGEHALRRLELRDYKLPKPYKWDKKWRMLIFDIPEKRKTLRDRVRRTLGAMGFERLQDSVWIYPYDCEDVVVLLKADFKVGKDLLYLIVDSLENDSFVRRRFNLPVA